MRIFVAQLNMIIGDFKGNVAKILQSIERGRERGCELILFSELALCGYPPEDLLLHRSFVEEMEGCLKKILPKTKGLAVMIGLARKNPYGGEKPLLNSAAVIEDGVLKGFYDKRLLPTYDVFDESRYFDEGTGPALWEVKGRRVAITICEDIWQHGGFVLETRYKRDPVLELMPHKPDLLLNLSASPYYTAKPKERLEVCREAALSLKCPVILCAQVGANDQLVFDGYSLCVDGKGELREAGKGFEEEELFVDLEALSAPIALEYDPLKSLLDALVLGVRDYFHKHDFKKGCLGLSGGIDSALTAVIAVKALGKENVLGITMPSRYSSEGSVKDSALLAKNLGIELVNLSIEKPYEAFLELLRPYFQKRAADVTEENLQARIRGILLMAFSNKLGYVVLSTGNKSEMAVGYATLYGDMCGGLGVLSDVTKTKVYALARFVNREKELIPNTSIEKPPSAELRPDQRDTDSLPDYSVVDAILEGYVERHLSLDEISDRCGIAKKTVEDLVHRIHLAEYKRRQAAPGIRVTKRAFSVGRRYPIVQKWK